MVYKNENVWIIIICNYIDKFYNDVDWKKLDRKIKYYYIILFIESIKIDNINLFC